MTVRNLWFWWKVLIWLLVILWHIGLWQKKKENNVASVLQLKLLIQMMRNKCVNKNACLKGLKWNLKKKPKSFLYFVWTDLFNIFRAGSKSEIYVCVNVARFRVHGVQLMWSLSVWSVILSPVCVDVLCVCVRVAVLLKSTLISVSFAPLPVNHRTSHPRPSA